MPGVGRRGAPAEEAARLEPSQDPAQIAGVEAEVAAQIGGGRRVAVGELVEHPHLGEREGAVEVVVAERADPAGVEAVEGADGVDLAIHDVDIVNELVDSVNIGCACGRSAWRRSRRGRGPCRPSR